MRLLSAVFSLSLLGLCNGHAKDWPVANMAEFDAAVKSAQPGDSIVMREGEWPAAKWVFAGVGKSDAPITLKAAVPGKTVLGGASQLRIGGEHLVVEGLAFRDPDPAVGDTIEFRRDSKTPSRHCRLTNCAVILSAEKAARDAPESHWVNLYGADHRIDHCRIQGKVNKGATLVVWLGAGNEGRHRIDHNDFGPRERLGENGGETIRVGDSKNSMQTASCVIEQNLFDRCNGEAECISNKSCGNVYRENTFLAVKGTLTLRHGNGCTVERNVFVGNDPSRPPMKKNDAGGVRIIGEDHVVRGNSFEGLTGDGIRACIAIMAGIPNSPLNGYFQVKRARIEGNLFVNCAHPILIGFAEKMNTSLPPLDTVFVGNTVLGSLGPVVEARSDIDGVRWEKNVFFGAELGVPPRAGIEWRESNVKALKPISRSEVGTAW